MSWEQGLALPQKQPIAKATIPTNADIAIISIILLLFILDKGGGERMRW